MQFHLNTLKRQRELKRGRMGVCLCERQRQDQLNEEQIETAVQDLLSYCCCQLTHSQTCPADIWIWQCDSRKQWNNKMKRKCVKNIAKETLRVRKGKREMKKYRKECLVETRGIEKWERRMRKEWFIFFKEWGEIQWNVQLVNCFPR